MEKIQQLQREIEKAITGKSEQLTLILSAWLAGGNILLEDIPGGRENNIGSCYESGNGNFLSESAVYA